MISDAQSRIIGGAIGTIIVWAFSMPAEVGAAVGVLTVAAIDIAAKGVNYWLALRAAKAGLEYVKEP